MRHIRMPIAELEVLARRSTETFKAAMDRLTLALFTGKGRDDALDSLRTLYGETFTLADLLGRRRLFLEADRLRARVSAEDPTFVFSEEFGVPRFHQGTARNERWPHWGNGGFEATEIRGAFFPDRPGTVDLRGHDHRFIETPVVPNVTFEEAVADIVKRELRLAKPGAIDPLTNEPIPLWRQVADFYQEGHAFAVARSTEINLTRRLQKTIADFVKKGVTLPKASDVIADMTGFSSAYADTIYRTNLTTAYSAGRFKQAQDPDIAVIIGGFEYAAVRDSDVRKNHLDADGLIASQFDPIWERFSPPLGYNCRCALRLVDKFELKQKGLLNDTGKVQRFEPASFSSAFADEGFERTFRPDRQIYG